MGIYYDLNGSHTSNTSALTESTHLFMATVAEQEPCVIKGIFATARFGTAGGGAVRAKSNIGVTASGGSSQTPLARNLRIGAGVAAQTTAKNDGSTITAGTTLSPRLSVGLAQTGGMGGWVPVEAPDALQMMPNASNPVDMEFTSIFASASVPFDLTIEFSEGA